MAASNRPGAASSPRAIVALPMTDATPRLPILRPDAEIAHLARLARMLLVIAPAYPSPRALEVWARAREVVARVEALRTAPPTR